MFFALLSSNPILILPWLVTILLAISLHEFSHALSAYWQGDDTAQSQGRLTPNPLAHIDWVGFLLLLFVGFGWGKPTPFNPYNLRFKKWGSALVSLAGPASNLIMMLASLSIYKVLGFSNPLLEQTNLLAVFLTFMTQINLVLCVFNLIPIPPLDGAKVLYAFLGYQRQTTIFWLERNGPWLLLGLILLGQSALDWLISWAMFGVYHLFGYI